jgi:hypothetical protein
MTICLLSSLHTGKAIVSWGMPSMNLYRRAVCYGPQSGVEVGFPFDTIAGGGRAD